MSQVVHEAQAIALTSTCLNLSNLSVAILIMAPASSESSKASAEQPALGKASAAQPGSQKSLPLSELNKASAKTGGEWLVHAFRPVEDIYHYTWQGKDRKGTNLIVTLVCAEDASQYCQGVLKKNWKNETKYNQIKAAMEHGRRFVMSKVCFVEDAKLAYVSCPLKVVVDLSSTQMDPQCCTTGNSVVQPVPTATVAGSADLAGNQFFDVTALIQEVTETREHANNRSSFVVKIYDGSLDPDSKKVKVMPLRMYFDTWHESAGTNSAAQPVSGESMKALVEQHLESKTAMSFFCISGAQDDTGKFSFRSTKHTFITQAVGSKAEKMKETTELHNLSAADTVAFELQTGTAARDWSLEKGKETRCGLLATFARTATGVAALDAGETIWQCNWVRINEPSTGQKIKNQFGQLWLELMCRDDTALIGLYITEKAVVKLTNVGDAAEFQQLHAESRLSLPFFSSIKVLRRPSKPSAAQPGSAETNGTQPEFDCFIVDAAEQDMQEIPSAVSMKLLPMLSHSADSVLPAMLSMIRKSEHYTMAVQYITQQVPAELTQVASKPRAGVTLLRSCSRAFVLVLSTKRSTVLPAGDGGYKLVTRDVVDLLQTDSAAQPGAQRQFEITSFCTLDNVTDFKLDPPKHEKEQAALVSVTAVINADTDSAEQPVKGFLVDDVQLLTSQQANALKLRFVKMLYFATLAGQISRKRAREPWSATENPADAATCRILGRSPTGPALPDYAPSS